MKKKFYSLFGILAVVAGLLAGCSKDKTTPPAEPVKVIVKALQSPANAANFELNTVDHAVFQWAAASSVSRAGNITYEVVFDREDGDFSIPVYRIAADEDGTATKATISKNVLIDIAREWGAKDGETAYLKWTVNTKDGVNSLLSEKSRTVSLERPEAVVPIGPPVVTEFLSPDNGKKVTLASIARLTFTWKEAEAEGGSAIYYKLLFDVEGGDFSEPIHSELSEGTGLDAKVSISKTDIDAIAGLAGIAAEKEGTLIWTVLSTVDGKDYLSEQTGSVIIKRLPLTPAVVTTLNNPIDGRSVNLKTTEDLTFQWKKAEWTGEGDVTYEVLFDKADGDFSSPLKTYASGGESLDPELTLSKDILDEIAEAAGAAIAEDVTIKWTVRTKSKNDKTVCTTSRTLKLIRASLFDFGDDLFIGGAGSEAGQKLKVVQDGSSKYYEMYTRLTANQPYYFYSGEDGVDGAKFVVNAAGNGFSEVATTSSASAKHGTTEVVRIRLDFDTKTFTAQTVTKVAIRFAISSRDATLSYVGRGTWRAERYNVVIQKETWGIEERYRFFTNITGEATEFWGTTGSVPSSWDGNRPMQVVPRGDNWPGVWKFPSVLYDENNYRRYYTDVVVNMNADEEHYTHHFENRVDSEAYYDGNTAIPDKSVWEAAADSITYTLIDQFMNKSKGTFWASAKNVLNNTNEFYWQQAYPMHTILYSYERIKNSNPGLAAEYRTYADRWIANNGNNWYGNKKNGFYNEYTDDMAWMALVFLHMYEIWGEARYLDYAKEIYGYMTETVRVSNDANGWSLVWKLGSTARNACTNTPAIIIAAKLYQITGTQQYLDQAIKMYDYRIKNSDVGTSGRVEEPPLTYTQGCWIEGCRLLYHITNESKYIDNATKAVNYTMTSGRCTNSAGLLRDEGTSGDQSNFKGGLMPYMVNYINDPSMPSDMRDKAKTFMIYNARMMWFHNMDKTLYPKTFTNFSFSSVYKVDGNPGSVGAHNSGAALMEGITRIL